MDKRLLHARQIDDALKDIHVPSRPAHGWVQAIRTALGLTTRQLAARMHVTQRAVTAMEQSEAADTISLQTLKRAAEALDCEVRYVLVPRKPLSERIDEQAEQLARSTVGEVSHSMALEAQSAGAMFAKNLVEEHKRKLLAGRWSNLWR